MGCRNETPHRVPANQLLREYILFAICPFLRTEQWLVYNFGTKLLSDAVEKGSSISIQ